MKQLSPMIKILPLLLLAIFWTGRFGFPVSDGLSWAWNSELEQIAPRHDGVFAQPHHPAWPALYGFFCYGHCPPPHMHQHFWHPAWTGPFPGLRPLYPLHPIFFPLLSYPFFPPYYEAGPASAWFTDGVLIPAGRLHLQVNPVHARAFVNGYSLQQNPDLSYEMGLLEGEHQVEITAEGYASFQQTVTIRGGQMLRLNICLEQAEKP